MNTLISHIINPADVEAYALAGVLIALVVCLLALVIARILRNPFRYPYFELDFDVSGKRNVHIDNLVDE